MKAFKVRITAGAERDLEEIVTFLAVREGRAVAGRILDGLLDQAAQLARLPERGTHPRELLALGIRAFRQVNFEPYRLIYRVLGREVIILVIADGRRDFQSLLERRLLRWPPAT